MAEFKSEPTISDRFNNLRNGVSNRLNKTFNKQPPQKKRSLTDNAFGTTTAGRIARAVGGAGALGAGALLLRRKPQIGAVGKSVANTVQRGNPKLAALPAAGQSSAKNMQQSKPAWVARKGAVSETYRNPPVAAPKPKVVVPSGTGFGSKPSTGKPKGKAKKQANKPNKFPTIPDPWRT